MLSDKKSTHMQVHQRQRSLKMIILNLIFFFLSRKHKLNHELKQKQNQFPTA